MVTDIDNRLTLLPQPRKITRLSGSCDIAAGLTVPFGFEDPRVSAAAERLVDTVASERTRTVPSGPGTRIPVVVQQEGGPRSCANGYRLRILPERIEITGESASGCFYALQTLRQIIQDANPDAPIACCEITDWPDFATRGLLHDVTRGKVPKLETLKMLADRLADLKCNQLQLNIEHAFVFSFDPEVCGPEDGLTPDEIRTLDRYCRDRFINLVPALASFGHMGRILSMPKCRHLAEIEATKEWNQLPWTERLRGFTLDIANPESHRLIEAMWSDVLDAFTAPVVNICGDEPHDLGRGKNRERFAGRSGQAYLEHIRRTHDICAARGRRIQFWSDVVRNYPEHFGLVPKGAVVLHWGYDDNTDYDKTSAFVNAGLDTIVCPGTSGWKRILNGMNLAERNISRFAQSGKACEATGLINTDWGDHGHFNPLACSWHGIALGAAKAWRADHVNGSEFDAIFARRFFRLNEASAIDALRNAARSGDACETWRQFWMPLAELVRDTTVPSVEELDRFDTAAKEATDRLKIVEPSDSTCRQDVDELRASCEFLRLWAGKMRLVHDARSHAPATADRTSNSAFLTDAAATATARYRDCWLRRNKPNGLREIEQALRQSLQDIEEATGKVRLSGN